MSGNLRLHVSYREMLNCKPYMVVIAFILQDSPDKMLTFCQLMDRLERLFPVRPATFRNTIRATLSSNKCFVMIPSVVSNEPRGLGNYWKLDHSKIKEETVHRNFRGLLEWFPELTSVKREMLATPPPPDYYTTLHSPEAAAFNAVNSSEVKFSSSFSIESILKKDSLSGWCYKASHLSEESSQSVKVEQESSQSVKVEQESSWSTDRTVGLKVKFTWDSSPVDSVDTHLVQCTGDSYTIRTAGTEQGLSPRPTKRMCMSSLNQQEKFNQCKTYLAMIAFVLQHSPGKMLTFSQLMDRLEAFGVGRTKYFENNIRVNLSAKKCFVKVPITPGGLWNNWKLDPSEITERLVCRHFEGILDLFPELTSTVRKESKDSREAAACKAVNSRCEVKQFSGSFSIDSILKKDSGLSE